MKSSYFAAGAALCIVVATGQGKSFPDEATFFGMCDASAAAAIDGEHFIVADDEDNVLRVFSRIGGKALSEHDLSEFLGNQGKKKPKEADLEGGAQIGSRTFWITSHGRNSKGKETPERQRLFATEVKFEGGKVTVHHTGKPYNQLLEDLMAEPKLAAYGLKEAAALAPKSPGALNIEGMASTPEKHLLIGFRNPIPGGKALLVPLINPDAVIEGAKAEFGSPVELDLGGLGIRSLGYHQDRYLIIAGAFGEGGGSKLYEWNGKEQPRLIEQVSFNSLNPEGIAFHRGNEGSEYFVLSDDGSLEIDGCACKKLKDAALKRFRGRVVRF
jgi:hypothetical protein